MIFKDKKSKEVEVDSEGKVSVQTTKTESLPLNNIALSLVKIDTPLSWKVVEIKFDLNSDTVGSTTVLHTETSRDDAMERFKILVAKKLFV